jgi:uncharacterized membrane protein YhaH (DUF805 family)
MLGSAINIGELIELFELILLRSCLVILAVIAVVFVSIKLSKYSKRLRDLTKNLDWTFLILFLACSAWATYAAFPTSEEKNGKREEGRGNREEGKI